MNKELDPFLNDEFGLHVQGAPSISQESEIDLHPNLVTLEQTLLDSLRNHPQHEVAYGLNSRETVEFTIALGSFSMFELLLPIKRSDGRPHSLFATVTPDSNLAEGRLRLAFLGRVNNGNVLVPRHLEPNSDSLNIEDVSRYLSGANQLCSFEVKTHEDWEQIPVVDPRHFLNAMAEFNSGSVANDLIEAANPDSRAHIGDTWESERAMMPIISAHDINMPQNDLVWAPISFLPTITSNSGAPFGVKFNEDMLDKGAYVNNKIRLVKADKQGALEDIQRMGFATLVDKDIVANFARRVEQRMI